MRRNQVTLVVALTALPTLAFGQSLADAARKEQERRAKAAASARVLDENDLKNGKGQIANAGNAPMAAAAPTGAALVGSAIPKSSLEAAATQDEQARAAKEQFWRNEASRRRQQFTHCERDMRQAERWADPTYAGADAPS